MIILITINNSISSRFAVHLLLGVGVGVSALGFVSLWGSTHWIVFEQSPKNNFRFVELFDTHPTYGNKCMTSEDAQKTPPDVDLEPSKSKSESWDNPNRQCCAGLPTWAILSVVSCVMNVRDQTCQAFVASSGVFGDCAKYKHFRTI